MSSTQHLWVRFHSSYNFHSSAGFQANIKFMDIPKACRSSYDTIVKDGYITSPFYPNFYPFNQICKWRISAHYRYIRFQIEDMRLSLGDSVTIGSSFEIADNSNRRYFDARKWLTLCQEFCNVTFKSDHHVSGKGFKIKVAFEEPQPACNLSSKPEIISKDDIEITSALYPEYYPTLQNCTWLVMAAPEQIVGYKFTADMELGQGDSVELRDGKNESAKLLRREPLNRNQEKEDYWSTSNGHYLWVRFISKIHYTRKGFKMKLKFFDSTKACKEPYRLEEITDDKMNITSPLYPEKYPKKNNCRWLVKAPEDYAVAFSLIFLELGSKASLEFRDGTNQNSTLITSVTPASHNHRAKNWWTSSSQFLWANFKSNQSTAKGFKIDLKFVKVPKACSSEPVYLDNDTKPFQSPFFPDYYANDQDCIWIIKAPQDKIIGFSFNNFQLAQPKDFVEIRDGKNDDNDLIKNFTTQPDLKEFKEKWASTGRYLTVRFKSDRSIVAKGFNLSYKFVNKSKACSQSSIEVITNKNTESYIRSPDYYPNNVECKWLVDATVNHIIAFLIPQFKLVQNDYLVIRDGKNESGTMLYNFTSENKPPLKFLNTAGQFLWLKFKSDRNYYDGKAFFLSLQFTKRPSIPTIKNADDNAYSPTHPDTQEKESTSLPSTVPSYLLSILIGVGIGCAFLFAVILPLMFFYIKKKRSAKTREECNKDPWEIDIDQVELLEEIGSGAFGKVWKGKMDSCILEAKLGDKATTSEVSAGKRKSTIVAVKTLHEEATDPEKKEFLREIELIKKVGSHPNLVSMIACCTEGDQLFLVMEYVKHGDLLHLLRDKRKKTQLYAKISTLSSLKDNPELTSAENEALENLLEQFSSFSWQIARGMEYLASKGIVHRDLAARNVLVADGHVAKVADFGLSRNVTYTTQLYQANTSRKLPVRWMSPEALTDQVFTTKSDVWSYAVVVWEIFSFGKLPYHALQNDQLLQFLSLGQRLEKPHICPDSMYKLMLDCWNEQAHDRPTFSDILEHLETLMTRDKPYVELVTELNEVGDGYKVPVGNSEAS